MTTQNSPNAKHHLSNIVVYCGSNFGNDPSFYAAAVATGKAIAERGARLIYGGGNVGLMGVVADSVLEHDGEVIGIIPKFLKDKEVAHTKLTELVITDCMAERKLAMIHRGDAFIALPGGIGTYEELFEVLSLLQLKQHAHPIGVLNINGFFDPLLAMLKATAKAGFMPMANVSLLCVADDIDALLAQMQQFEFVDSQKWVKPAWMTDDKIVPSFIDKID
ncbi:TIGR00730 family Rossman fold protein [Moraxella sp. FZLJ2107]|uniref:LOG family protein n=1 Tax=unclassified Moraxella TaxID=2685852 RepID=UPI0020C8EE40|nr:MULTISPECIES: TIGR00730 family Rossman fold protein [unclassified Moraxella]UTO05511.1 TIGR00730 family Rossman fold protein [Moraxella sp. FZLJ2107]UTO22247.1 TIGR00730 family Rossman fold protein [Moraxella sp. FZLJ2109]